MSVVCYVGLGNPVPQYSAHRHNIGMLLIEQLAERLGLSFSLHTKSHCRHAIGTKGDLTFHLVLPVCYMNESGLFIRRYLDFYKMTPQQLLVAHDELDFEAGEVRWKAQGGHAGHNGLRSIHQHLNTDAYQRLRVGIGHPGAKEDVAAFVLNPPTKQEQQQIDALFDDLLARWDWVLEQRWDLFQELFHRTKR